jgi:hypothetical protein
MSSCCAAILLLFVAAVLSDHPNDGKYDDTNVCVANAGCCFTIDFTRTSQGTFSNATGSYLHDKMTIYSLSQSPWAEQGVSFSMDPRSTSDPETDGYPYRLWAFNVSNPAIQSQAYAELYSAEDDLVLTPRTISDSPASRNFIISAIFTRPILPCISKVRMLRTIRSAVYTSVSVETHASVDPDGPILERKLAIWGRSVLPVWETALVAPGVARVIFTAWGAGYAALSELQICYPPPAVYDACGVCYGQNTCARRPEIGDACDTGLKGACSRGQLATANNGTAGSLKCVSIYSNTTEICNGLDDDCDGSIDEDMPYIQCGVGQCFNRVSVCANGTVQTCVPLPASIEVCDGLDNNCNGLVDEDGVCDPLPPPLSPNSSTTPYPNSTFSPTSPPGPAPPTTVPTVWTAGVVPHAVCYTPYTTSICSGTFSYSVSSTETGGRNVSIPIGTNNQVQPASYMNAAAGVVGSLPTFFIVNPTGGELATRFTVYFACSVPITWAIGDGRGRLYLAVVDPQSVSLCDSSRSDAPVTPFSEGCTTNGAGTDCILYAG